MLRVDRSDLLKRIDHNERIIAASDLRDEIHGTAPADLASMGVDRADLRWAAARAYIRNTRAAAITRVDLGLLRILMFEWIAAFACRRGAPQPDQSDFADAALWFERKFAAPAPSLEYIPAPFAGKTSEGELLRLAGDQRRYEAARKAWLRQLLAA